MIPGFVEVDIDTFYDDIWPQIKDDVEILESSWDGAKKGTYPAIIAWGYKDHTQETITLAISRLDATEEKHWVVPTLIQKI